MKPQNNILEPGRPETDFFYYNMPAAFRTGKALELFTAAERAGLLCWTITNQAEMDFDAGAEPNFELRPAPTGPIKTRAQLAYWCKRACLYLGIERGGTTNWKPFEALFGAGLKRTLHDLYTNGLVGDGIRLELVKPINDFFATLNTSTNEQ